MMLEWNEILVIGSLVGIVGGAIWWGYKRYQIIMADGKITIDEIVDSGHDLMDKIATTKDEIDEVLSTKDGKALKDKLEGE